MANSYYPDDDSHIVIDIERMEEALNCESFTPPPNLTRDELWQWLNDCADGKIEPDKS